MVPATQPQGRSQPLTLDRPPAHRAERAYLRAGTPAPLSLGKLPREHEEEEDEDEEEEGGAKGEGHWVCGHLLLQVTGRLIMCLNTVMDGHLGLIHIHQHSLTVPLPPSLHCSL
jgi:hypothetical protein